MRSEPLSLDCEGIRPQRSCSGTVEAADAADVQVPQDGVSPQVQVVRDGLQGQSGKQQIDLVQTQRRAAQ